MSTPSLLALLQSHGWKGNIPVVTGEVETVAQRFGIARLPPDYQEVLTHSNGGSLYGFIDAAHSHFSSRGPAAL